MMNPQEFYIQHLGIGSIWKLRQLKEEADAVEFNHELVISEPVAANKNTLEVEDTSFDILILRLSELKTSDSEQLCENIVQAMRYGNQFEVSLNKKLFSEQKILFEQLIQLTGVRVIAFFESDVLQNMRHYFKNSQHQITETNHQDAFLLNGLFFIQFHTFAEMTANPLLKKDTWEKICLLQTHLHNA
jgi:hypothetical protein